MGCFPFFLVCWICGHKWKWLGELGLMQMCDRCSAVRFP